MRRTPTSPPPNLFIPLDLPDWVDPAAASDDSIICSEPVQVDFAVLGALDPAAFDGQPSAPIQFNLLDGVSIPVIFTHAEPRWSTVVPENPWSLLDAPIVPIGYTWHGSIVGDNDAQIVMVTGLGSCDANIHLPDLGWIQVNRLGDGTHVARHLGSNASFGCAVESGGSLAPPDGEPSGGGQRQAASGPSCEDGSRIDLIVVYTPLAREIAATTQGGNPDDHSYIQRKIDNAISAANTAYGVSLVATSLRLVYKGEVDYTELPGATACDHLNALQNPWDGQIDDVHPLRDCLRADLVSLIVSSGLACGTGPPPGGIANIMTTESPAFESQAFSLVKQGWLPLNALAHEVGHNKGCAHQRGAYEECVGNCDCQHGAFSYSFGYNFPPSTLTYFTIMCSGGGNTPHFSNPSVLYRGYATGEAPPSCNSADNATTINLTRDTVAKFRTSTDTTNTTKMASYDYFTAGQANAASNSATVSDSGQYLAFSSDATNFGGDLGVADVFLFNRESGIVTLLTPHVGSGATGNSSSPAISGNGRFVAFASDAADLQLVGQDNNNATDIFVFGQQPASMVRVSVDSDEGEAHGGGSSRPSISRDGRRVAFESEATSLIGPGADMNVVQDIFVRDRNSDGEEPYDEPLESNTIRASVANQTGAEANRKSSAPSICANLGGQFVAFESEASNLVAGDSGLYQDIFVRDLNSLLVERVSVGGINTEASANSYAPSISPNGNLVTFESDATNLVTGDDIPGHRDIFLRNRVAVPPQTTRISVGHDGSDANGHSYAPNFSGDGKYIVFHSEASNLLPGNVDTNLVADVFLYEVETGVISRVNVNSSQQEAMGGGSFAPAVSFDARFIAFESDATNLVIPNDQGGFRDIFFRDRGRFCPADINNDAVVNALDLALLLGAWGACPECSLCPADLDHDGDVDPGDLALLLGAWGPC